MGQRESHALTLERHHLLAQARRDALVPLALIRGLAGQLSSMRAFTFHACMRLRHSVGNKEQPACPENGATSTRYSIACIICPEYRVIPMQCMRLQKALTMDLELRLVSAANAFAGRHLEDVFGDVGQGDFGLDHAAGSGVVQRRPERTELSCREPPGAPAAGHSRALQPATSSWHVDTNDAGHFGAQCNHTSV